MNDPAPGASRSFWKTPPGQDLVDYTVLWASVVSLGIAALPAHWFALGAVRHVVNGLSLYLAASVN
jgi:hypothetical protein